MIVRHLKPPLLAALLPGRHAVIEASAGTGKTYTLEHLVIELLLTRGARIEEILVVTFTEKATAELKRRVRELITTLLDAGAAAPAEIPDEACWILDDAARAALGQALSDFDRACICTIHAFCQRLLTEHAFASGRLFREQPIDERTAFSSAFREVLRRKLARDPELVPFLDGWLRWEDGDPAKLEDLLYRCHCKHSPLEPAADPARLTACLRAFPDDEQAFLARAGVTLSQAVAQLFLPVVRAKMAADKRDEGRFDFQDMLELIADRLDGEGGARLIGLIRERWRYALIDEFQDTDQVQWRIFRKAFFEAGEANPLYLIGDPKQAIYGFRGADVQTYLDAKREVAAAGGIIAPLTENFRSTGPLIAAYNAILDERADPPFFTGEIRYDAPVTCGRPSRAALMEDGTPAAPVVLLELPPGIVVPGKKQKQKHTVAQVRRALGRYLATEIRALLAGALRVDSGDGNGPRPLRHRDIFILTRSLAESEEAGAALREAGVPHAFYKQDGLFQTAEAEDVRDLLAAVEDPHHPSLRLKAWLTPFFGLELGELSGARDLGPSDPLFARLLAWKTLADDERWAALFARILDESGVLARALYHGDRERALTNYLHLFELLLEESSRGRASLAELLTRLRAYIGFRAQPEGLDGNVQRLESERDAVQVMTMHKAKGLEAEVVFLFGGFSRGPGESLYLYHDDHGVRRAFVGSKSRSGALEERIAREQREEDQRLLYVALTRARSRLYLPWFPDGSFSFSGGCYEQLNHQLGRLRGRPDFARVPIALDGGGPLAAAAPAPRELASFRPAAPLLDEPRPEIDFAELARAHAGFQITSYTRMKGQAAGARDTLADDPRADERPAPFRLVPADDELPGGPETGIFLHELLEKVELTSFAGGDFEVWRARPEVRALVDAAMRRHDRDPRHRAYAERLVHTAYTAPLRLGDAPLDGGLAGAARALRELEFLFPWPEASHPRLGEAAARAPLTPLSIERGYVKGFIDLVCEHQGRAYLADWKSDLLADWEPARLAAHVEEHYRLQARLYALALVKLLGISDEADYQRRFGGLLFCFLRGMRPGSPGGVHFERPRFADLQQWEERLRRGAPLDSDDDGEVA
ncbi:MAG TPA: UvrD-helicase domain-containing protein [Polyangia bacterium]